MSCKVRLLSVILMIAFPIIAAAQDIAGHSVNVEILAVTSEFDSITYYDADERKMSGKVGMSIPLQSTILTDEGQRMECVIRHNGKPAVGIIISEVTDFYFDYDSEHDIFCFELHYGRARIVSDNNVRIITQTGCGSVKTLGCDYGIISIIRDDGAVYEAVYDFDGRLSCQANAVGDGISAERWDRFDTVGGSKTVFSEQELLWWQDTMLFDLTSLPSEIPYILENLLYPQRQDILIANYHSLTDEEKEELIRIILGGIFRFNAGYFYSGLSQMQHGLDLIWLSGATFMNRRLEFYLDMSVGINVSAVSQGDTDNIIHKVNFDNNPWSFGSDHGDNAGRIAFDIFDDLLMKLGMIRYGFDKPTEQVFIQAGNYFDVSDKWHYSFFGFNPRGLSQDFRHNSFAAKIHTRCFETFIYAEDILPRGVYGLTMKFMTPAPAVKWKLGFSAFMDCYDLMKFGSDEMSFFPLQTNLNLEFSLFDVPTFGFDMYLNGGLNFPFCYNFESADSYFSILSDTSNAAALFANVAADLGMVFRIKSVYLIPELIVDSRMNRVGQFDMSYSAKRHLNAVKMTAWYYDKYSSGFGISDIFFGSRLKLRVDDYEYIKFELAYQVSIAYSESWSIASCFYDKFHFTINANNGIEHNVGFSFAFTFQIEELAASIAAMTDGDYYTLPENTVAFMTLTVSPFHIVDIYLTGGIRPDINSDMRFTAFVQSGVTLKPNAIAYKKK